MKSAPQTDHREQRKQTSVAGAQRPCRTAAPAANARATGSCSGGLSAGTSRRAQAHTLWSLAPVLLRPATCHTTVPSPLGPAGAEVPDEAAAGLCAASSVVLPIHAATVHLPQADGRMLRRVVGRIFSGSFSASTVGTVGRGPVECWEPPHSWCGKHPCRVHTGSWGPREALTCQNSHLHGCTATAVPHWLMEGYKASILVRELPRSAAI